MIGGTEWLTRRQPKCARCLLKQAGRWCTRSPQTKEGERFGVRFTFDYQPQHHRSDWWLRHLQQSKATQFLVKLRNSARWGGMVCSKTDLKCSLHQNNSPSVQTNLSVQRSRFRSSFSFVKVCKPGSQWSGVKKKKALTMVGKLCFTSAPFKKNTKRNKNTGRRTDYIHKMRVKLVSLSIRPSVCPWGAAEHPGREWEQPPAYYQPGAAHWERACLGSSHCLPSDGQPHRGGWAGVEWSGVGGCWAQPGLMDIDWKFKNEGETVLHLFHD